MPRTLGTGAANGTTSSMTQHHGPTACGSAGESRSSGTTRATRKQPRRHDVGRSDHAGMPGHASRSRATSGSSGLAFSADECSTSHRPLPSRGSGSGCRDDASPHVRFSTHLAPARMPEAYGCLMLMALSWQRGGLVAASLQLGSL